MRSTRSIRTASSSPCPERDLATSIRASGRHLWHATLFQAPLDSLSEDRKASVAKRRLRLRPAHKRGGLGSRASEPERLHVDATRPASHGAGRVEWKQ